MPPSNSPTPDTSAVILRQICLISYIPALPILLAHGIASRHAFPALGLLPLSASALLGATLLFRDKVLAAGSPIQLLSAENILVADIAIATLTMAFLIPSWIMLTDAAWNRSLIALGAYGTVFPMLDFGVHIHFILQYLVHYFTTATCDCPHCRSVRAVGFREGTDEYLPLNVGREDFEEMHRDPEAAI